LAIGLALLSATSRIAFVAGSQNDVAPEVFTLFRCDALLIGSALALLIRSDGNLRRLVRPAFWIAPALAAAGIAATVMHKRVLTIPHTLWPLLWACVMVMLLTAQRESSIARFFRASWLRKLGKHSYAMYVVQSPLIPVVTLLSVACPDAITSRLIVPANSMVAAWAYVAAMFALTYAISLVTWYVLEQPCLQLKNRFAPDTSGTSQRVSTRARSLRSL
jgi:peptidoglycan/LPS O-acetylase OafA/YrhL